MAHKLIKGYHLNKTYTRLVIYLFGPMTLSRLQTITVTTTKGVSRKERYKELCKTLKDEEIPVPSYRTASRKHF
jgi:hypothetical protein